VGSCCSSDNCEKSRRVGSKETACPRCGAVGKTVTDETIHAILKPADADRLVAVELRFCRTSSCAVLYYGADGRTVEKSASSVRVGWKETEDPIPLCYCFAFTRSDVQREVAQTGDSSIPERIEAEIRSGRCDCERKNPSGACCLSDVRRAVKEAKAALAGEQQP
jgi:Zinc binding domain